MPNLCLVFDLDDTLFLERDYVRSGCEAVGLWATRELGIANLGVRAYELFEAGEHARIFDLALIESGKIPGRGLISEILRMYRTHRPNISLPEDARECLDRLKSKVNMAIVTDGREQTQMSKCIALGICPLIDPIVINSDPATCKPDPRSFERVMRNFGNHNHRFVYFGDNPLKDFEGPKLLGWTTVRVRRAEGIHREKKSLPGVEPDLNIPDMSTVPELFI